jgi:hypothetical protein
MPISPAFKKHFTNVKKDTLLVDVHIAGGKG